MALRNPRFVRTFVFVFETLLMLAFTLLFANETWVMTGLLEQRLAAPGGLLP
jgi:hypothetical protein